MPGGIGLKGIHALVDTGATQSCIDSSLAMNLGLKVHDQLEIAGIGGKQLVNLHIAQIFFPALGTTMFGQFAGVHLAAGGQSHSALVGRDFLAHFIMTYNGTTGQVVIRDPAEGTETTGSPVTY